MRAAELWKSLVERKGIDIQPKCSTARIYGGRASKASS
jgi:hypothetical protein